MREKVEHIVKEIEDFSADSKEKVEEFRIKWLSRNGKIAVLFEEFKTVGPEMKKEFGQKLNQLKKRAEEKFEHLRLKFQDSEKKEGDLDLTLPVNDIASGSKHPLSIIRNNIIEIF